MRHLTEEELIEHYFYEDANRIVVETHLRICGRCEQEYDEISNALAVRAPEPPAHEPGYGQRVWQSIQQPLQPYAAKPRRRFFSMPRLAFAGACLLFLAAAFIAGRAWERMHPRPSQAAASQEGKERVVLFILDDHLDRSERLLVQLNHAGSGEQAADLPLQAEARQLLPDNRLYRQSLAGAGDPLLSTALDHLERVLLEVANSPGPLSSADIARLEKEMNTDSLLFEIRVLRARVSSQQPKSGFPGKEHSSI
jgi:hypothetical protein